MTILTFYLLLSLTLYIMVSAQPPPHSIDRPLQIARNNYLRFYIYKRSEIAVSLINSERIKDLIHSTKTRANKIYNSFLSKYNDAQTTYYSLSPDTRELIEQLINLHF
jgi:hypothetical protein